MGAACVTQCGSDDCVYHNSARLRVLSERAIRVCAWFRNCRMENGPASSEKIFCSDEKPERRGLVKKARKKSGLTRRARRWFHQRQ